MPNKYLSYDAQRAPRVHEMFSRVAARYDLLNDVMSFGMHRRWKRLAAQRALEAPRNGEGRPLRLLDLCCGTGDLAFEMERQSRGGARIAGLDFTLPMLTLARSRRRDSDSACSFAQGDALSLPFADRRFDAVTIGYGLRNVSDPGAVLGEVFRVLVPGGRVVVLDFGKPDGAVARMLSMAYLRATTAAVGWLFHGDPDTYLYIPESLERYPAQRGVEQLMREVGFARARYEERALGAMGINIGEK